MAENKLIHSHADPMFFDELPLWSAPFGLQLLETIPVISHGRVLDVGCGTGFLSIEMAQRFGHETEIIALDIWQEGLEYLNKKAEFYGIKNIKAIRASAEALPFQDGSIDMVVSNNGINNSDNFMKSFKEACRVIKTGGYFAIAQNHRGTFDGFYNILLETLIENNRYELVNAVQKHIRKKRKTTLILNRELQKHGFIIFGAKNNSFTFRFASANAFYQHHFIKSAFYSSWEELLGKYSEKILSEVLKKLDKIVKSEGQLTLEVPFSTIIGRKAPGME
ncbi:MAG: class I SAM-dependent methyltransferase [Bacteroidales bacterium]|nr:class I SAM-dependent methyltransferase [Bacteroidales bacterium]